MHRRGAKVVIALGDSAGRQRIDARVSTRPAVFFCECCSSAGSFAGHEAAPERQGQPWVVRALMSSWRVPVQTASRIVEAAQAAGASQLVLVSPSGAGGGGGGFFGGFLGGGGSSSAVEEACDPLSLR